MLRRALLLPLAAAVLALVACGGGSRTLTKAQYDAKVSRLCLVSADAIRELHFANMIVAYRQYANILHIGVHFDRSLASLMPPASIAREAAVFLVANKKVLADDRAAFTAAKAGDRPKFFFLISKASSDNLATYPPAKAIGATGCYIP